jgi:hypothetical protein
VLCFVRVLAELLATLRFFLGVTVSAAGEDVRTGAAWAVNVPVPVIAVEARRVRGPSGPLPPVIAATPDRRGTLSGALTTRSYPTGDGSSASADSVLLTLSVRLGCISALTEGSFAVTPFCRPRLRRDPSLTMWSPCSGFRSEVSSAPPVVNLGTGQQSRVDDEISGLSLEEALDRAPGVHLGSPMRVEVFTSRRGRPRVLSEHPRTGGAGCSPSTRRG